MMLNAQTVRNQLHKGLEKVSAVQVLLIDPDHAFGESFQGMFLGKDRECHWCHSIAEADELASTHDFDLVFVSSDLPEGQGVKSIPTLMQFPSSPEVVLLTSGHSLDYAEEAIVKGAWDYLSKPCSIRNLNLTLRRAMRYRENKRTTNGKAFQRFGIIGTSAKIEMALDAAAKAANSHISTLLHGETGTGKELFARAIHGNSSRADGPFVVMDCTNIPENLTESILFGHVKGAFTGATDSREGLFSLASGGTLLLDEVGELELQQQKSLLRVLQEQRFRPVGSSKEHTGDFRLLAATNKDLKAMVADGSFRQDLYYRLTGILIHIPPLRKRPVDAGVLLDHYLEKICTEKKSQCKRVSSDYREAMLNYPWPGNVRELINAVYFSYEMAIMDDVLLMQHLPMEIRVHSIKSGADKSQLHSGAFTKAVDLDAFGGEVLAAPREHLPTFKTVRRTVVDHLEGAYLQSLIDISDGSPKKACEISGLSKARLYELLKKQNLSLRQCKTE